jgi:DNA-binding PadR family transcriptional regulator
VERRPTLSLNEWAVLGLLVEQPRHGYDIAAELAPGTEVGEVWRLSRALVYRAIGRLESLGLVRPEGTEPGRGGPPRTVYGPTPEGTGRFRSWLTVPVEHLRDLRSGFLLKVVLAQRAGVDRTELVRAQRQRLEGQFTALADPPPPGDAVAMWRHHSAAAARAFLEAL